MRRTPVKTATTSSLNGWIIDTYLGLVSAHVVAGTGIFSDFAAGLTDFFGGRSGSYQKQLASLEAEVLDRLAEQAQRLDANWVIGIGEGETGEVLNLDLVLRRELVRRTFLSAASPFTLLRSVARHGYSSLF